MSFSDHQDFDFSKDFLLTIDLFAAAYIMLCSSIAAAFKSFKLSLFEWFKWEKSTCLAWRRISSENNFQSVFFKLKNWEQIEFSTNSAALILILNFMISWSESEALDSSIY